MSSFNVFQMDLHIDKHMISRFTWFWRHGVLGKFSWWILGFCLATHKIYRDRMIFFKNTGFIVPKTQCELHKFFSVPRPK